MVIYFQQSQLGSILGALYFLGTAIILSALIRAVCNK